MFIFPQRIIFRVSKPKTLYTEADSIGQDRTARQMHQELWFVKKWAACECMAGEWPEIIRREFRKMNRRSWAPRMISSARTAPEGQAHAGESPEPWNWWFVIRRDASLSRRRLLHSNVEYSHSASTRTQQNSNDRNRHPTPQEELNYTQIPPS